MGKKEEYKEKNLRFLEEVATGEGVVKLPCGVLYKEIEKGTGVVSPELTDGRKRSGGCMWETVG